MTIPRPKVYGTPLPPGAICDALTCLHWSRQQYLRLPWWAKVLEWTADGLVRLADRLRSVTMRAIR